MESCQNGIGQRRAAAVLTVTMLVVLVGLAAPALAVEWQNAGNGNWTDGSKWLGGLAPNASDATAQLWSNGGHSGVTIDLSGSTVAVGTLSFDNTLGPYHVVNSSAGTLSFQISSGAAAINVLSGAGTGPPEGHSIDVPVNLLSVTTVTVNPGAALTMSSAVTGTGTLTLAGAGTFNLLVAQPGTTSAPIVVNNTTSTLGGGNTTGTATFSGPIKLGAGSNLTLTCTDFGNAAFSGVISGTGTLTVTGVNSVPVVLSGPNTFTGDVVKNGGGYLRLDNASGLGNSGNTLYLNSGILFNNVGTIANPIVIQGGNLAAVNGNRTFSGPITIAADTGIPLYDVFNGAGRSVTLSGKLTGSASLGTFAGGFAATLTLSNTAGAPNASTYSGLIIAYSSATVQANADNSGSSALALATVALNGGTLALRTNGNGATGAETPAVNFAANNLRMMANGTVSVDHLSGTATNKSLQLRGITLDGTAAHTLTVTNANSYQLTFTGTVSLTAPLTVTSAATTVTFAGPVSGAGSLTKSGAGALIFTATNNYTGTTTIAGGTGSIQLANGGTLGTGPVVNTSNLIFNRSDTMSVNNLISGAGTLTVNGPGTVILTNANTYSTFATNINAGATLLANNTVGSATGTSLVIVNSGATLGGNGTVGRTTASSGCIIAPGATPGATGVLTVNSTLALSGVSLNFDLATPGASDRIKETSGLTASGTNTINLNNLGGFTTGTYTLLSYGTFSAGTLSNFALGATFAGFTFGLADTGSAIVLTATAVVSGPNQWALPGHGAWGNSANWTSGQVPDAPGAVANLWGNLTFSGSGPDLEATNRTVGTVAFENTTASYSVSSSGGSDLIFDGSGKPASITFTSTNTQDHAISAPIQLNTGLAISLPANPLTLSGALDNSTGQTISKTGNGILVISGAQNHGGGAMLAVGSAVSSGGTVYMNSNPGATTGFSTGSSQANLTLRVTGPTGGASIVYLNSHGTNQGTDAIFTMKDLSVDIRAQAALVVLGSGDPRTTGNPDGSVLVQIYGGGVTAGSTVPRTQVESTWAAIRNGYGLQVNSTGAGSGITTHTISDTSVNGLGMFLLTDDNGAQYLGLTEDILGDVNGDRTVTPADAAAIIAKIPQGSNPGFFGLGAYTWIEGDMNYDGLITPADAAVTIAKMNQSYSPSNGMVAPIVPTAPTRAGVTATPEPGTLLLLGLGGLLVIRRSRCKKVA